MKRLTVIFATIGIAAFNSFAQDHGHLNVGAVGINQNDALIFDEGEIFDTAANYVKTLVYTNTGAYAGHYVGNITFTGLAATSGHPAASPNASALGSWLFAQLSSVEGPAGGAFAFWEAGATSPTISVSCGTTGTNVWRLTEANGGPGTDPYGHIHGRRFSATRPGVYTVGFRAFDLSTNGASGGPIHTPSSELKIYFEAGVNVKGIKPGVDGTRVTFAAPMGKSWMVEASDALGASANWSPVGTAVTGDDYFHEITDEQTAAGQRFYRTKGQ